MSPEKTPVRDVVNSGRRTGSALLYRLGSALDVPAPVDPSERPAGRSKVPPVSTPETAGRKPYITELVHWESSGHPTGEPKACRPALVIEIPDDSTTEELELAIFRRNGIQFARCRHEEDTHLGGTWHYAHD